MESASMYESVSMYSSLIGSDTSHEKINYLCLNVPYIEADSVQWGSVSQSESCTWGRFRTLRPILMKMFQISNFWQQ